MTSTYKQDIHHLIEAELEYFRPMQERARRFTERDSESWRLETVRERHERISMEVYDLFEGEVRYGIFAGMKLRKDTWWGKYDLGSQCLGLYEQEVLSVIEALEQDDRRTFIELGAGDGYYAVGGLLSNRFGKAICFEQSERGQQAIRDNWEYNGAPGEIAVLGVAEESVILNLDDRFLSNAFVLVDIEGAEFEVLTDQVLRKMRNSIVVVEIHNWVDNFNERYSALLKSAAAYFEISIIERMTQDTYSISELRDFTDDNRALITSERRPCMMRFLKFEPAGCR